MNERGWIRVLIKHVLIDLEKQLVRSWVACAGDRARVLGPLGSDFGVRSYEQEIVAELSAAALCQVIGKAGDKYLGNSHTYIERYASEAKMTPLAACFQVIADVEKVLQKILASNSQESVVALL